MSKKGRKILALCLVVSMILTQLIFTNVASAAEGNRLYGSDRYQTAIKIAQEWDSSDYAVLAYGEDFPDALTAAPLAKKYDAPILLTDKAQLSAGVLDELKALKVKTVFVVGGEGVVSKTVADAVAAAGITVERLAGTNRYETALKVAEKVGTTDTVVVAYGENYPDALSVSPIAAAQGWPILLTDTKAMDAAVKAYIGSKKVYVIGGTGVVSDAAVAGLDAERVSGADRYATNVAVLTKFDADLDYDTVYLATGENYPDALAGSALAAMMGAPVVLVGGSTVGTTYAAKKVNDSSAVVAFGGSSVVSSAALSAVTPVIPETLTIQSVSLVNAKTIQVKFSKAVEFDTVIDDQGNDDEDDDTLAADVFSFTSITGSTVDVTANNALATLSDDAKTLTIEAADAQYFDGKYAVTITSDIEAKDDADTTLVAYSGILTADDTTRPTVKETGYKDYATVKVTFSEPLADIGSISTSDETKIAPEAVTFTAGDDYAEISLAGADLDESYKVTFVGASDYAGNLISPNPYEITVKKSTTDKVKPTVVSVTAKSTTKFEIKFSEKLIAAPVATVDGGDGITGVKDADDATLYSFTLDAPITELHTVALAAAAYTDLSDNDGKAWSRVVNFVEDTTDPTVASYKVEKIDGVEYLVVTYDENVTPVDNIDISAKKVKDYVETSVTLTTDTTSPAGEGLLGISLYKPVDGESKSVKIELTNLASDSKYTFTLPEGLVLDGSDNPSVEKRDVVFDRTSNTDPEKPALVTEFYGNGVQVYNSTTLYVKFNRKLDATSALNISNYVIEGATIKSAIFTQNDADVSIVKLTLNSGSVTINGPRTISISGVKSSAGVAMKAVTTTESLVENVKPTVTKAELTSAGTVKLTFSEAIENVEIGVDADDFAVFVGSEKTARALVADNEATVAEDGKSVVLNLNVDLSADDYDKTIVVKAGDDLTVKDLNGNSISFTSVTVEK